jgi:tRNA modification GTPase
MNDSSNANRVVMLTAPGTAAIAVVRLIGPRVDGFLRSHFSKTTKVGRHVHGQLLDDGNLIDDPVVVRVTDDVVDLNLHGGVWVVQATIELAERERFVFSNNPDDWPKDAWDAGSQIQREILQHLPAAKTELAIKALLSQETAWNDFLHRTKTNGLDRTEVEAILRDRALERLLDPPAVAIVGIPNAGKSTLANQLFAQERSITADVPGTTRDWVGEIANIDGLAVMLVDTPGRRLTTDPIEQTSIDRSRVQIEQADLIVLLLDASQRFEPEQAKLFSELPTAMRVINKVDRPHAWNILRTAAIHTVAASGRGVDLLRNAIIDCFECAKYDFARPRAWTKRQREVLHVALDGPDILAKLF